LTYRELVCRRVVLYSCQHVEETRLYNTPWGDSGIA